MKRIIATGMAAAMAAASAIAVIPTSASALPSGAYAGSHHGPYKHWRHRDRRDHWPDRRWRRGDRDDWGAAAAGTIFGLALGGAFADRGSYGSNAHVNWCMNNYRTYNPRTNLYYYAPGRQRHCNSPYAG